MIALVDYGASNLKSVAKAIAYLGYQARVTSSPQEVEQARAVVLPGVGAARATVEGLEQSGLGAAIRRVVAQGRPFLGLCVGLQVLFTTSQEGGGCPCLDILPGEVVRLPAGLKVPHIGWNRVWQRQPHPIYEGIPDGAYFYFVHSYYASPRGPEMVAGGLRWWPGRRSTVLPSPASSSGTTWWLPSSTPRRAARWGSVSTTISSVRSPDPRRHKHPEWVSATALPPAPLGVDSAMMPDILKVNSCSTGGSLWTGGFPLGSCRSGSSSPATLTRRGYRPRCGTS